ncbi:hypothetical protein [Streptomyces alkaliterrae]|uniref:hypothetical protein n=1 Tax=Streptomyces alkaliterrae TaxID=2213162 RepID=UPI001E363C5A|nr:hypothetical protein [Streptomyces alkaliterrae]
MSGANGGERRVPADAAEALEIGRTCFPETWGDGTPVELRVHEFDIGYLVHAVRSAPVDPTRPPELGGSHVVVSKETGDITTVPNFPEEQAVELYRRGLRSRE